MLGEILKTLREHQGEENDGLQGKLQGKLQDKFPNLSASSLKILEALIENPRLTALELTEKADIKERMVRNHLLSLKEAGVIERIGSSKKGYWKINL